jgi:hypothetical protein
VAAPVNALSEQAEVRSAISGDDYHLAVKHHLADGGETVKFVEPADPFSPAM